MRMIGRIAATNPKHSRPSRHILTKQTARCCIVKWIQVRVIKKLKIVEKMNKKVNKIKDNYAQGAPQIAL